MRGARDEAAAPKYAHIERERRWLVDPMCAPNLTDQPHILIEDRYIRDTRLRLRQMADSRSGDSVRKLTKKYASVDVRARPIVTTYLDAAEYDVLAALPANSLAKRRFAVGGFSLDVFLGRHCGLILAERECPDHAALLALSDPEWAKREVTDDQDYAGGTIAARYQETRL